MTNETTRLVQDESRREIIDCGEKFQNITREFIKYIHGFAVLAALGLSIAAIVFAQRENTRLNQTNEELDSIKEEITVCYNDSYSRIQELAKEIDDVESSMKSLIADVKSSLEIKIEDVQSSLNTRFISVQNQVSDLNTNVNKMESSLGSVEDSTNKEFSKVWDKFKEVDKEIANLPRVESQAE